MNHIEYDKYTDNQLIAMARDNDDKAMEYLIMKYGYIVKHYVRTMFLIGAESEDLMQEGTIGLFKAIRDYKSGTGASFATFATTCIKRQIDTAIKTYNRKKHNPLNESVSISVNPEEGKNDYEEEMQDRSVASNPELAVLMKEKHEAMLDKIDKELSPYEKKVVELYLEGYSHSDMAAKLGKEQKSIDNALSRIRVKLSK